MSDLTELPEWVWNLLDTISDYEDEHPILYRMTTVCEFEATACFGAFLSERKAWPPREIQDAAAFRRHVIREHSPATTHRPETTTDAREANPHG